MWGDQKTGGLLENLYSARAGRSPATGYRVIFIFLLFFSSWVFIARSLPISGRARANMCYVGYVGPAGKAGKVRF